MRQDTGAGLTIRHAYQGAADDSALEPQGYDWVVADASWTWTEQLFSPLAELGHRVLLFKACDWRNAIDQRLPAAAWLCPEIQRGDSLWERRLVLPPGWMKTYPKLGMRPFCRAIRSWRASHSSARPLVLSISYPHYAHLHRMLRPDALVYYNMDDYACYWRFRGRVIRRLEREVVRKADLSVICARARADALIADVPEAAGRIVHLPHGARGEAIVPRPLDRPLPLPDDVAGLPRPVLGFVGSLEDRVDWTLISNLARAFPEGSIALIGQTPRPMPRAEWYSEFRSAVDLSNVHLVGWRSNVESYASAFDICLIPYLPKHPFNHAACPTKVMDYMATTRPVVSTAVPECALYRGLFHVADSHIEFISCCRRIIDSRSDDGGAAKRWSLARTRTWDRTAAQLSQELFARIGFSARAS